MARPVKCIYCEEQFDRDKEEFIPVRNRYAHKHCQEKHDYKQRIIEQIHNKMAGILGVDYSKTRINKQIKELLESGKTELGILRALEYWYDIKNGDPSLAHGSIRIVNFIYGESLDYWQKKEDNKKKNLDKDVKQILNPEVQKYIIHPTPIKKPTRVKLFDIR